jgi:hypothetical protein
LRHRRRTRRRMSRWRHLRSQRYHRLRRLLPPLLWPRPGSLRGCSRLQRSRRRTFRTLRLHLLPLPRRSRPEAASSQCRERRGRSRSNGRRNRALPANSRGCSRLRSNRNPLSPPLCNLRLLCPHNRQESSPVSSRPRLNPRRARLPHRVRVNSRGSSNHLQSRYRAVRRCIRNHRLPARMTPASSLNCSRRRWSRDRRHSGEPQHFRRLSPP